MHNYYVYVLIDPEDDVPRYVGKGRGSRIAQSARPERNNKYKNCWLRSLQRKGLEPVVLKVIDKVNEATAFAWEMGLIDLLGRFDQFNGSLFNETDGGEGMSGHKPSFETLKRLSEASKAAHARPEVKQRHSEAAKAAMARPEVKQRLSEAIKAAFARPGVKQRQSEAIKVALARPEVKQRLSEASKAAHARPEVKQRQSEASKAVHARPEVKQRRSEALKAAHARPEVKQRHSEALKAAHARPEVKQRHLHSKRHRPAKGKFKGISFNKSHGKWQALISIDKKTKHLGSFVTAEEAARAYNTAVDLYWGGDGWKNPV